MKNTEEKNVPCGRISKRQAQLIFWCIIYIHATLFFLNQRLRHWTHNKEQNNVPALTEPFIKYKENS